MVDKSAPGLPGADEWGKGEFLDLFGSDASRQPLAARMRPRTLDEYFGQVGIVGPGQLLRRAIEADRLSSLILWGPPGTGKTSLASVIARGTKSHFETINAVMASSTHRTLRTRKRKLVRVWPTVVTYASPLAKFCPR